MGWTVALCLATTAVGLMAMAAASGGRQGALISPFATSTFVLVSVFGIRPLFMIGRAEYGFYGYDVSDGVPTAAAVGLLATSFLALGYFSSGSGAAASPIGVAATSSPAGGRTEESSRSLTPFAVAAVLAVVVWFGATAYVGGGARFIVTVFRGRSAEVADAVFGVPVLVGALSTAGTVMIAYGRIVVERMRPLLPPERVLYWIVGAATVVPPIALGTRRFLLPSMIVLVAAAIAPNWRRRLRLTAILGAVLVFFVLAAIPFVRSAGSRAENADVATAVVDYFGDAGWSGAAENYFLSYDTEMFSYVAFMAERLGSDIDYGYGSWIVGDSLLAPLPGGVLSSMQVSTRSDQILEQSFGGPCVVGPCPVPSAVGVVFSDFGVLGIPVAFLLLGALWRRVEGRLPRQRGVGLLVGLVTLGFAPVIVRGNTVNTLWLATNVLVLSVLATRLIALLERSSRRRTFAAPDREHRHAVR